MVGLEGPETITESVGEGGLNGSTSWASGLAIPLYAMAERYACCRMVSVCAPSEGVGDDADPSMSNLLVR